MTDSNDAATREWPEAHESQQPDGQRLHAVTLRVTHTGIFMKDKAMSERERIAYEELQVGDVIQPGDEWQNNNGRWHPLVFMAGACIQVRDNLRARRPYKISTIQEIGDALANAQKAATQLQDERDEALVALKSAQRARDELQLQVDELRAGLMGVVSAQHVHSMLEDMLDQTEWVGRCLDSSTYEQMSCIQRTISVIAQRVNDMGKEGSRAND